MLFWGEGWLGEGEEGGIKLRRSMRCGLYILLVSYMVPVG